MRPSTEGPWSASVAMPLLDRVLPRLLSQIDRDPDSPTFGSCDRAFWLYRLHDFDSGVLQQAGLTLACLAALVRERDFGDETPNLRDADPDYLEEVARAVNRRTAQLLAKNGFLDEYYPGEQSFPGTVFAAYAVLASALMLEQREVAEHVGLRRTAERLVARSPSPAANQDVAAAAFLALYAKAHAWQRERVRATVRGLLAGPDGSGRCIEYGGGDLGYSSVSLNYLAYMLQDESYSCGGQLDELAGFVADFVSPGGDLGGEYSSRSTTYWLPFGMLVAARRDAATAARMSVLDMRAGFDRLDDRYLMHYCLPSLARATLEMGRGRPPSSSEDPGSGWRATEYVERGLLALRAPGRAIFVGLHKGATYQAESVVASEGRVLALDTGYRIHRGALVYATCVLDPQPEVEIDRRENELVVRVRCRFWRYRSLIASPSKTVALRLARGLGPNLNTYFKNRLISDAEALDGPRLSRTLRLDRAANTLVVDDEVSGLGPEDVLSVAPPVSLRLVPSARFWQAGEASAFARLGPAKTRSSRQHQL